MRLGYERHKTSQRKKKKKNKKERDGYGIKCSSLFSAGDARAIELFALFPPLFFSLYIVSTLVIVECWAGKNKRTPKKETS